MKPVTKEFSRSANSAPVGRTRFSASPSSGPPPSTATNSNASPPIWVKLSVPFAPRTAAAATQIWIQLVGVNEPVISNNVLLLTLKNETASYTIGGTTACVDAYVTNNVIQQGSGGNTQDKCVSFVTGTTGIMRKNFAACTSTGVATAGAFVGDAMFMDDNKFADTAAASGLLAPAVDTDT